ncbi:alpha/beta hydrolase [Streptomyces sp. 8K308]|uniref:alpha/beta hydrolase n=1 Tax=Streptomyces sp. 8K308 TaxID=2530388 RepID=UPI00104863D1|nr:alpha/beta hydrolase [Streptomyces sp. 8K308]TDC27416.1 alpha/beta hydrolase [Streptomyces sp. 8K308]
MTEATEDRSVLTRPAPAPDEVLRYGPDTAHHVADVWRPAPGAATGRPPVVFLHGGFWRPDYDRGHTRPLAAALRDAGWPVVSAEYRRVPGRPDLTTADVRAVLTALAALPGDAPGGTRSGYVLAGHSAGGHLALWAAAAPGVPPPLGTLALAPVADLRLAHDLALDEDAVHAFLGAGPGGRPDLDPVRAPGPGSPVTILHGAADRIVPPAVAASYAAAHPGTRLVRLPGAGHFAVIDPLSAAWPAVPAALAELGGPSGPDGRPGATAPD